MATYYVSNIGSNSYNGLSPTFTSGSNGPWLSCSKVNSSTFSGGDQILFRRGDTFVGPLNPPNSGSSGNNITFGAYSTGNKPIISGMVSLTWTALGSNIYSAPISAGSRLNIVTFGGLQRWMGRSPQSTWATSTSHTYNSPNSSITGSLSSSPNFNGGEVVIKKREWMIDRHLIVGHSGSTITYAEASSGYDVIDGFGYFVQNHVNTLTYQDAWYYDSGTSLIKVYSTSSPTGMAANQDVLCTVNGKNYITFDNIRFEGANQNLIRVTSATGVTVQNCEGSLCGVNGFYSDNTTSLTVTTSYFDKCNNEGIYSIIGANTTISQNMVTDISQYPGAGNNNNASSNGITINGSGALCERNIVTYVGNCGINCSGTNLIVRKNFIRYYCTTVTDGGGIYMSDEYNTNKLIEDNICLYGYGNSEGTPYIGNSFSCFGIYLDESTANVTVNRNTCAFNGQLSGGGGLYLHKAHDNIITNNILYANLKSQFKVSQDLPNPFLKGGALEPVRNNVFTNNLVFSSDSLNYLYWFYSTPSPNFDISLFFSSMNNNVMAKPMGNTNLVHTYTWTTDVQADYTFSSWKSSFPYDSASTVAPTIFNTIVPRFEYNDTNSNKVVTLDGTYMDTSGTSYVGSITISPYQSKVLAKVSSMVGTSVGVAGFRLVLV